MSAKVARSIVAGFGVAIVALAPPLELVRAPGVSATNLMLGSHESDVAQVGLPILLMITTLINAFLYSVLAYVVFSLFEGLKPRGRNA